MWFTAIDVLCLRVWSSSNNFLMIFIAGSMGTDVNKALTSNDIRHSSFPSFILLRSSHILLMAPKDKDPILKKSGVIYRFKCGRVDCDEEYIGESSRTFAERFKKHQKTPSPIFDHSNISGHQVTIDNFNIVGREDQNLSRTIKEALYIRVNNPSLNKNIGKYHLPHIWDEVLLNTSELKLK